MTGKRTEPPTGSLLHFSIEFERDAEGWWPGRCNCGWDGGFFPEAEDATDALMQHAREQGYLEAQRDALAMQRSS